MNNTIKDDIFGKITFDGLNWIKEETVVIVIAGREHELSVEIQSPDIVYDWKRLGKLKEEVADRIFDPELGGIHHVLSELDKLRKLYTRAFLHGKNGTCRKI